jgi:uncharacterized membrane protein
MKTFFYFLLILALSLIITYVLQYIIWNNEVQNLTATPSEECLIAKVAAGEDFVFSETSPGQYDYQVYATANGYEVWGKCK